MNNEPKFVKYEPRKGTICFEAQSEIAPSKFSVARVTESEDYPGSIETVCQPHDGQKIEEDEFMDAYMRVVNKAMEGEFMDDDFDFAAMEVPDKTGTCGKCGKVDHVVQTHIDGDSVEGLLCYDCCGEGGYCFGCGVFASGLSEYDFSRMGHYCEHCQDQIRTDCGEDY